MHPKAPAAASPPAIDPSVALFSNDIMATWTRLPECPQCHTTFRMHSSNSKCNVIRGPVENPE